jgi:hypothetical protein
MCSAETKRLSPRRKLRDSTKKLLPSWFWRGNIQQNANAADNKIWLSVTVKSPTATA